MVDNFVIIPDKWSSKQNFWDYNYQIRLIYPFSELYERDNSVNKEHSSKECWAIWMLCDPSPKNRIWRSPEKEKSIEYWFPEINIKDEVIQECIAMYDEICLTPAARAFKSEEQKLVERAELMRNTPYTFDEHIGFDKTGRAQIKPGTVKDLETMAKNSLTIYKNFEIVKRMFLEEYENNGRVWGGREETFREKGDLPTKEELGL